MDGETKIVRQIGRAKGTLTNQSGSVVSIYFNLIQTQAIMGGILSLRCARGALEFASSADADLMHSSSGTKTLTGGGIRAKVHIVPDDSFKVMGLIIDV